ncbi:hypothetical protein [Nostoc sp.]|uniref:hypothetical protein n=1 Tax=Nostoc sp. TaxID=1180 RepID=UPI002FF8AC88
MNLAPLPCKGRGWGLSLYWTQARSAIFPAMSTTGYAYAVAGIDLTKNFDIFSPYGKILGLALYQALCKDNSTKVR